MEDLNIAKSIRMAMTGAGVSGIALAEYMGVSTTTVSRWRKRGCSDVNSLASIAYHCDMSLGELMEMANSA